MTMKQELHDGILEVSKSGFIRYPHLEKLIHDDVAGLLDGDIHVFPKIDGTNGSVWLDKDDNIRAGSRNRTLSLENDNAGFLAWVKENDKKFRRVFDQWPTVTLYGEWLVPHTLKTYREDAWKQFYIFDVFNPEQGFIEYETYKPLLSEAELPFIPCATIIKFPTEEQLLHELGKNTYLIADGKGEGEGITLKRYGFVNIYGRTTWGKIVRTEFKDKHVADNDPNEVGAVVTEAVIVDGADIVAIATKVLAKMRLDSPWENKRIPELLGKVWHDFFHEELWTAVKALKNPTIDMKRLMRVVADRTKKALPEVF